MLAGRVNNWIWAVVAWIGVIFFSSTSLASKWAEGLFNFISSEFLSGLHPDSPSFGIVHLLADKGFHVSLFCVLAILLWLAVMHGGRKWLLILLAGASVGACSELLQRFFPDRDPAVRDVLINIGGTALGLIVCKLATRVFSRHRSAVQV